MDPAPREEEFKCPGEHLHSGWEEGRGRFWTDALWGRGGGRTSTKLLSFPLVGEAAEVIRDAVKTEAWLKVDTQPSKEPECPVLFTAQKAHWAISV